MQFKITDKEFDSIVDRVKSSILKSKTIKNIKVLQQAIKSIREISQYIIVEEDKEVQPNDDL